MYRGRWLIITDTLFVRILLLVARRAVAMSTSRHLTLTALGLCLFLGCSADKSGAGHGDAGGPSNSGGVGGKNTGKHTQGGTAGTGNEAGGDPGGASSDGGNDPGGDPSKGGSGNGTGTNTAGSGATAGNSANGNGGNGTGPNGSVGGNTFAGIGGTGNTGDPPPAQGGTGTTGDPPGQGGTGTTGDPPGQGGTGTTGDPPGQGGTGTTGDPPGQGGTGTTADPTGGTGNTNDPAGGAPGAGGSGTTGDPPDECVPKEIDRVNVVVFKDAKPTGADSEGAMWVGGTLEPVSGDYSVAAGDLAHLTCTDWGLVVGGAVTGSVIVKSGKVAVGGVNNVATSSSCGVFKQKPVDFSILERDFQHYSARYERYPANGTVSGSLVFTGKDSRLNVFDVSGDMLAAASGITISAPLASSVIINVSGKDVTINNKGFTLPDGGSSCKAGTSSWCHRILWNFYEAETLSATGIGIEGSVLAPFATFNTGSGMVDGQVIVKYLNGSFEYHPYFFSGCLMLPKD
jgi:choice-of-anchor A domain-containing protein